MVLASIRPGANHVKNFVDLAAKGFYDGTLFHRVIKGFMIQGGDPNTKDPAKSAMWGAGGPGYKVNAEFNANKHVRGTLSMARASDPNSAGSQFFICHAEASYLDGQYTVFGELLKGYDVLDKIATGAIAPGTKDRPKDPVKVIKVTIRARTPADVKQGAGAS
jgi:peptidyl-prolyl cis-trans isomerase B (cyclophilin B)